MWPCGPRSGRGGFVSVSWARRGPITATGWPGGGVPGSAVVPAGVGHGLEWAGW